jgi:predicted RNA-binding protein with PUA domain
MGLSVVLPLLFAPMPLNGSVMMNPQIFSAASVASHVIRHSDNVMRGNSVPVIRENKNPHAVALGRMSSPEKASAAKRNGAKGGRPEGS